MLRAISHGLRADPDIHIVVVWQIVGVMIVIRDNSGRDSVAIAIEGLLSEMQQKGMGSAYRRATPTSVIDSFADCRAEGESIDIALVKLAGALLDNEKYAPFVMDTLKGRIRSDAA